jgi:hypothetical protein
MKLRSLFVQLLHRMPTNRQSQPDQTPAGLKWDFGSVDAETAAKIMNLINEIGA